MNIQLVSNLTRDITELQSKTINFDKMFMDYQNNHQSTYKLQIENLKLIQGVLKDFYEEEISHSKNINNQLSGLLDDILLNEKTLREAKNKKIYMK